MATWNDVTRAAPDLALAVQRSFDAHIHKTLATLRADGSPRISGQEASFRDGDLWLGMMPDSRKAKDLQRDPRLALHSATVDPELPDGDAKLSGRADEVTDQETFEWFIGEERAEKGQNHPSPSTSSGSTSTRSCSRPSAATHPTTSSSRPGAIAEASRASSAADSPG